MASNLLANAAAIEGNDVQSFPYFGVERRGAPVSAFTRINDKPIRIKSQIYEPDYVIVLDASLVTGVNVTEGLKDGGIMIVNTPKLPEEIQTDWKGKIVTTDATAIAIEHGLGSVNQPIVNTSLLGAFARVSEVVKIESIIEAIHDMVPRRAEDNASAAQAAYDRTEA